VVSVTDPHGSILGFLDRSRYFSIKLFLNSYQLFAGLMAVTKYSKNYKETDV
jgi:hypothetical protein